MSSIVLEYFQLSQQYQNQYGTDTVVFFMVGSFYEIYSLVHPTTNTVSDLTPIVKVASICNLNIANKQSTIGENSQLDSPIPPFPSSPQHITSWTKQCPPCGVVMAGVRDYCGEKYIEKLTNAGFTVVVYDQVKTKEGTKEIIQRKLQSICSPGTSLSTNQSALTNHILCIWIEKTSRSQTIVCGVANVNTFTGETTLFEYTTEHIQTTSFDELERIICSYAPSEVILISNLSNQDNNHVLSFSGISQLNTVIHQVSATDTKIQNCTKQTYVRALLQLLSTTNERQVYDCCEEFHTYPFATQAFCYLLDFVQEHNKDLVRKLSFPTFQHTQTRVILANRTLRQLNILGNEGENHSHLSSVERFLNKCSTPMGKRLLKYQLLHPTFDCTSLQHQYDQIEHVLQINQDPSFIHSLRKHLTCVRDIDKICRQIVTKKLLPSSLFNLYESINTFSNMKIPWFTQQSHKDSSTNFLKFLDDRIRISLLVSNPNDECFIQTNHSPELDCIVSEQIRLQNSIGTIQQFFETFTKESILKLHETEKGGITLQLTKKRATTLRNKLSKLRPTDIHEISADLHVATSDIKIVSVSTSNDELTFPQLNHITKTYIKNKESIKTLVQSVYLNILQEIEISWYETLQVISRDIAQLDVLLNKAYVAREYNYCSPRIIASETSQITCQTLRHPLIEQIQTQEIYVPNDITLDQNGILLTGYNGIGKTSLIRALGISILLAQSGFYVPCSSFVFTPYRAIYCNIEKNDNLFKHLSTFQLEMSELRVILKHSDAQSLVLGDELMNSTEIQSGLSIMTATLMKLCEKKTSFVIATHFNQLKHYDEIIALGNLRMMHMSVQYDQEKKQLVYDRTLKEGFGSMSYGLEVARSLFLDSEFLDISFKLRNKYFPDQCSTLSMKASKYSSKKLKGVCEQCYKKMGSEVHHVREQHHANAYGFIGHVHKHHPANLMNVCEMCHLDIHKTRGSDGSL